MLLDRYEVLYVILDWYEVLYVILDRYEVLYMLLALVLTFCDQYPHVTDQKLDNVFSYAMDIHTCVHAWCLCVEGREACMQVTKV